MVGMMMSVPSLLAMNSSTKLGLFLSRVALVLHSFHSSLCIAYIDAVAGLAHWRADLSWFLGTLAQFLV